RDDCGSRRQRLARRRARDDGEPARIQTCRRRRRADLFCAAGGGKIARAGGRANCLGTVVPAFAGTTAEFGAVAGPSTSQPFTAAESPENFRLLAAAHPWHEDGLFPCRASGLSWRTTMSHSDPGNSSAWRSGGGVPPHAYDPYLQPELFRGVLTRRV